MKCIISWLMMGVIAICSGNPNMMEFDAVEEIAESKISDELLQKMEADEAEYSVMVWLKDIDYETVNQEVEAVTHHSWNEIEMAENAVYAGQAERMVQNAGVQSVGNEMQMAFDEQTVLELSVVQMQVDEMIITERQIASEAYMRQNISIVDDYGLQMDVEYVSRYAPAFFANLTKGQILELSRDDQVEKISYLNNEVVVDDDIEMFDKMENAVAANTVSVPNTSYLTYMGADKVKAALNGSGVKIGLMDAKKITSLSHSELKDANIVPLDEKSSISEDHSINMARIICGTYGIAPKSTVYSYGLGFTPYTSYMAEGIELMIDNGVTVINCSLGHERRDELADYEDFEKWIDHIASQHSVTFVVAAGNNGDRSGHITMPGTAYNAITVANVDHTIDTLKNTSAYDNKTGCEKPDVAAPGSDVLMYYGTGNGGTSSATACVTGMVALMMQAKPSLAKSPHIIKAIVIASCDHIAGSSSFASGYDEKQGAGVVNVARAITIISKGQYIGDYRTSNGTATKKVSVDTTSSTHTYVFVGLKMNIATGSHGDKEFDNIDMAKLALGITSSTGNTMGYCNLTNSSVQLVRASTTYSEVYFGCVFSDVGSRGVPYAIAWY